MIGNGSVLARDDALVTASGHTIVEAAGGRP